MKILDDDDDDDDNYNNGGESTDVLSASMSTRCGASSGCEGGDGHQILRVAGNILNKQQRTSDKGCPRVRCLGEVRTSQQHNSLLHYRIFHKASDWG